MSQISASQIDTFEDCSRHWWFQRILKLTEPPASHFTFGTVLHAVNERYLSADKNQRVPGPAGTLIPVGMTLVGQVAGRPVNQYPPGWETATERDGSEATVTKTEAKLIQKLVAASIENGVLRWREDTQVEREVLLSVIKGVQLIGYIDAFKPAQMLEHHSSRNGIKTVDLAVVKELPIIEDHKTYGKGSLRYLMRENSDSPNFLGENQQVLTYAWATSELDGWEGDVTVRHNQYPKFPDKDVTSVETTIPRARIVEHGVYLREVAERMERVRKIKDWADVPGPKDTGKCSRWYGKPCPFSDICGRAETPDAYKARLERLKSGSVAARLNLPLAKPKKRSNTKDTNMTSIFDRANKQKAKRTARKDAAGTTKARAAVAEPSINGATPEPVATITGGAPWSNPDCKACKGRGLTSKHKACPICDNTAKKGKRPTSMAYILELTDENTGIAVARAENVDELEAAGMPLEWDESESAQEAAPAPAAQEAASPASDPKAQEEPSQPAAKPAKRKRRTKAEIAADKAAKAAAAAEMAEAAEAEANAQEQASEQASESKSVQRRKTAQRGAGRPRVGLTVLVGANYLSGMPSGRPVITSSQALARFGAELAEDMGAESYYDLDSFKRRDRLAQKADYIVTALAGNILIHPGILGNDDEGKFMQAIMSVSEGIEFIITRIS